MKCKNQIRSGAPKPSWSLVKVPNILPKNINQSPSKRERLKITKSSKFLFKFCTACWTPLNKNLESLYWMKIMKLKSFKILCNFWHGELCFFHATNCKFLHDVPSEANDMSRYLACTTHRFTLKTTQFSTIRIGLQKVIKCLGLETF